MAQEPNRNRKPQPFSDLIFFSLLLEKKARKITQKTRILILHRGPCDRKNSIPIENFNPGSKFSIPIEAFNLDRKFQSPSFHLRGPRSVQRWARSKISIHDRSLEIFNPEGRDRIFSIPGPSGQGSYQNQTLVTLAYTNKCITRTHTWGFQPSIPVFYCQILIGTLIVMRNPECTEQFSCALQMPVNLRKSVVSCALKIGNENSARSFSDRVVDVRAFGSWMSAPKCLFFQDSDRLDRSFGPGYPRG